MSLRHLLAAASATAMLSASCFIDTRGLTGRVADGGAPSADTGAPSVERDASAAVDAAGGVSGCAGVDAAVCEDFDGPTPLEGWRPPQLTNGGQLSVDSATSVSSPHSLWSRTPAQGPVPRTARVLRLVTLGVSGFAVEMDVLVESGCAGALAIVTDDLSGPYYQLELVAARGQPFFVYENDNDKVTAHAGSRAVPQGWTRLLCEVSFASPTIECFVGGQRALAPTAVKPARPLAGRAVHVGIGVNYDDTTVGCSARIDNYVFRTW